MRALATLAITSSLVLACHSTRTATRKPAPAAMTAGAQPVASDDEAVATLRGTITAGETTRGKSMAAWNGFDIGERVYYFTPASDQAIGHAAPATIMLHAPPIPI